MDVNTTEIMLRLITLAKDAIDAGQTVTIKADDITINSGEMVINNLEITTAA